MTTDTVQPWMLPAIPDHIKRITIDTDRWDVEFYVSAFPNDNGDIWQDLEGDYQSAKFALAASVCEIPGASEGGEWDCYPEGDGWIVFAPSDGGDAAPQGEGATIASAIRDAFTERPSHDH